MDIALAFTEAGSGTPLILLPGTGAAGTYFAPHIAALARHFRVIALDTSCLLYTSRTSSVAC